MPTDDWKNGLQAEIAALQSVLKPLESGQLRLVLVPPGGEVGTRTKHHIDDLKRVIANLQAAVDRYNALRT